MQAFRDRGDTTTDTPRAILSSWLISHGAKGISRCECLGVDESVQVYKYRTRAHTLLRVFMQPAKQLYFVFHADNSIPDQFSLLSYVSDISRDPFVSGFCNCPGIRIAVHQQFNEMIIIICSISIPPYLLINSERN